MAIGARARREPPLGRRGQRTVRVRVPRPAIGRSWVIGANLWKVYGLLLRRSGLLLVGCRYLRPCSPEFTTFYQVLQHFERLVPRILGHTPEP